MAKPEMNFVIERETSNLLAVWTPSMPALAKELIEAIGGVSRVEYNVATSCFHVWLNPCYNHNEVIDEIKAACESAALLEEMT